MMRKTSLVAIGIGALLAAACGNVSENIAERITEEALEAEGGGDVDIDFDSDGSFEVNVESDDGSFTIGGGEIPSELTVPIPSGGEVQSSFVAEGDVAVSVAWPASEYDSLVAFYEDWTSSQSTEYSKNTSTFESDGTTLRNTGWYSGEADVTISVNDCYSMSGDGLDACVTITESGE